MTEKEPRQWSTRDALVLMYFSGGGVWWLLTEALPWVGIPPLCITVLWICSYFFSFYLAGKLGTRLKR